MLWTRIGDGDDYHSNGSIAMLARRFRRERIRSVESCNRYGVTSDAYQGNNYISLYWGDIEAQPLRELTAAELAELNSQLRKVSA
jgi:hypothetical protein